MTDDEHRGSTAVGATRERALVETFVLLADTLVADYDVVDLLDQLAQSCVQLLGISAAGLLLTDQRGHLRVMASSSEEGRLLEIFQLQNDEGPCLDCVRLGESVISADLDAEGERWPTFVPEAVTAGFRSVTALPLRLRDETIGGLNLFDTRAGSLSESNTRVAQALADVATIGILQQRSVHRTALLAEQLQHALSSRVVIEQAKGVLAERNHITMDRAFEGLRLFARNHNRKLSDVALDVVRGDIDPATVGRAGASPA